MLATLAAIGWEPEIRGALVVLISVVVLCGSVYLLLATNSGVRLGFLMAFTGLMGWMTVMGFIWWIYGIGLVGESPTWQVEEAVIGDISAAEVEDARELPEGWIELPEGDGDRGEAEAVVDEFLAANEEIVGGDYVSTAVYDRGGKDKRDGDSVIDRWVHKVTSAVQVTHPTHRAVVQVQAIEEGASESEITPDTSKPTVSVVLVRDLGNRRFPPAMVTLASGILFAISAWELHRRDKAAMEARAAAGV